MKNKILSVKNLFVMYGKQKVLKDLSFEIEQGDYVGVVGPNGAGKSTLIKVLLELEEKDSGEIEFFIDKNEIGYLPQISVINHNMFPASVAEIVSTGLLAKKKFPKKINKMDMKKVEDVLGKLKILNLKDKKIGDLSGGEQQRVFLSRALVDSPKILILDEPTSALDPKIRNEFYELLNELNHEWGITIILISHDVSTIGKYTSKMLYLDKTLIFYGSYSEFCESKEMTEYFGFNSQHQFCWRHNDGDNIHRHN